MNTLNMRLRAALRNPLVQSHIHSAVSVTLFSFIGTCLALWVMR